MRDNNVPLWGIRANYERIRRDIQELDRIAPPRPRSGAESAAGRGGGQREENG